MKKLNLMLAVGDSRVDPKTDPLMNVEPKSLGRYHYPTTHAEGYEALSRAVENSQLRIAQQECAIDKSGARFFTIMELESPYSDYSDLLVARWSTDQKIARTAAGGSGAWICSNLCIGGMEVVNLKHTKNMGKIIQGAYETGIAKVLENNKDQRAELESFRNTQIRRGQSDRIIMEMLRRDIITSNHIKKIDQEYKEPRHEDHKENGMSVWRMFSAVTEVAFKPAKASAQEVLYTRGPKLMELLKTFVKSQS